MPAAKPMRRVLVPAVLAAALAGVFLYQRAAPPALLPAQFVQEEGTIISVQYSRDGRILLEHGYSRGGRVVVRDAATGALLAQWHGGTDGLIWLSADGTRLVCSEYDPKVKTSRDTLRDTRTGRVLRAWTGSVVDANRALSQMLVADDWKGVKPPPRRALRLVDVPTGRVFCQFTLRQGTLGGDADILNKGRFAAIANDEGPSLLLRLPACVPVLPLPPLCDVRVSRDDKTVIAMDKNGTLHLRDISTGRETRTPTGLTRGRWAAAGPDNTVLVGGDVQILNNSRACVQVWTADGTRLLRTLDGWPAAWDVDNNRLALPVYAKNARGYSANDPVAEDVYSVKTGARLLRLDVSRDPHGNPQHRQNGAEASFSLAPDGHHFAFAAPDGLLRLYDTHAPQAPYRGRFSAARERPLTIP